VRCPQLQATHAEAEVAAAVARAEEAEERARLVEREATEERSRAASEAATEVDRLRCELVAAQTKLATAHAEFLTVSDERDAAVAEKRLAERSAVRAAESEAVEAELRDVCAQLQVSVNARHMQIWGKGRASCGGCVTEVRVKQVRSPLHTLRQKRRSTRSTARDFLW